MALSSKSPFLLSTLICWALVSCEGSKTQSATIPAGKGPAAGTGEKGSSEEQKAKGGSTETGAKKADDKPSDAAGNNTIPAGPTTAGAKVANGPLSFDLAGPKPALAGAQFSADLAINPAAGNVPASISLTNMAIKAGTTTGLVLYRPVLVLEKASGEETQFPIGTNINQKVAKGRTMPLAAQMIAASGINAGDTIKLRFSALEPLAAADNSGVANYRECKAPQNFTAFATALAPCKACHNGLFNYDFIGRDTATACGLNLKLIDASLLPAGTSLPNLQRPVSGGHPATSTTGYSAALSAWKAGEGF